LPRSSKLFEKLQGFGSREFFFGASSEVIQAVILFQKDNIQRQDHAEKYIYL
jgi:hypothetical protein